VLGEVVAHRFEAVTGGGLWQRRGALKAASSMVQASSITTPPSTGRCSSRKELMVASQSPPSCGGEVRVRLPLFG
jgi:hypothetical protein